MATISNFNINVQTWSHTECLEEFSSKATILDILCWSQDVFCTTCCMYILNKVFMRPFLGLLHIPNLTILDMTNYILLDYRQVHDQKQNLLFLDTFCVFKVVIECDIYPSECDFTTYKYCSNKNTTTNILHRNLNSLDYSLKYHTAGTVV